MRQRLTKILVVTLAPVFFVAVPPAIWYCKNYNPVLIRQQEQPPVILNVVTVECGKHLGTIRRTAAEYSNRHRNVRIFITPLSRAQLQGFYDYDVLLTVESEILHNFITTQDTNKRSSAQDLLTLLNKELLQSNLQGVPL